MAKSPIFAPREVFEQILEYAVIPTFDLIVELPDRQVVLVRRKIAPYAKQWALPGLRMYKNETINQTLERIASQELGLVVDASKKRLLTQFVGNFTTEHHRQDISTCYVVPAKTAVMSINGEHFSAHKTIASRAHIPSPIGAMYKHYLEEYYEQ